MYIFAYLQVHANEDPNQIKIKKPKKSPKNTVKVMLPGDLDLSTAGLIKDAAGNVYEQEPQVCIL